MIRIPVPSGVASIFAVLGALVLLVVVVAVATDPARAPKSPGGRTAARIVGALMALLGLTASIAWLVPGLGDLALRPGPIALCFAASAIALALGQLRKVGALAGALGATFLVAHPLSSGGPVYGELFMPALIPLTLAIAIVARRRRAEDASRSATADRPT